MPVSAGNEHRVRRDVRANAQDARDPTALRRSKDWSFPRSSTCSDFRNYHDLHDKFMGPVTRSRLTGRNEG